MIRTYESFIPLARLKLAALNHSANSLFFLILQWLEHWTYPYQEYTLPVKLKNQYNYIYLYSRALRLELRNIRLKLTVLPIKLCSSEKRWIEHLSVKTQYLANILPYQ